MEIEELRRKVSEAEQRNNELAAMEAELDREIETRRWSERLRELENEGRVRERRIADKRRLVESWDEPTTSERGVSPPILTEEETRPRTPAVESPCRQSPMSTEDNIPAVESPCRRSPMSTEDNIPAVESPVTATSPCRRSPLSADNIPAIDESPVAAPLPCRRILATESHHGEATLMTTDERLSEGETPLSTRRAAKRAETATVRARRLADDEDDSETSNKENDPKLNAQPVIKVSRLESVQPHLILAERTRSRADADTSGQLDTRTPALIRRDAQAMRFAGVESRKGFHHRKKQAIKKRKQRTWAIKRLDQEELWRKRDLEERLQQPSTSAESPRTSFTSPTPTPSTSKYGETSAKPRHAEASPGGSKVQHDSIVAKRAEKKARPPSVRVEEFTVAEETPSAKLLAKFLDEVRRSGGDSVSEQSGATASSSSVLPTTTARDIQSSSRAETEGTLAEHNYANRTGEKETTIHPTTTTTTAIVETELSRPKLSLTKERPNQTTPELKSDDYVRNQERGDLAAPTAAEASHAFARSTAQDPTGMTEKRAILVVTVDSDQEDIDEDTSGVKQSVKHEPGDKE